MKKYVQILILIITSTYSFGQNNFQTEVGDIIEPFSALNEEGINWNSSSVKTDFLVVYFYPAAMTGGCTKQACAYRDDKVVFDEMGISIVAISGDEVKNLKYFKDAYQLNFPLLSDNDGSISKKFGIPTKKGGSITREFGGEEFLLTRGITTPRWTFVLDKNRKIIYKNAEVNASEDSKNVQEVIKNYQNK